MRDYDEITVKTALRILGVWYKTYDMKIKSVFGRFKRDAIAAKAEGIVRHDRLLTGRSLDKQDGE